MHRPTTSIIVILVGIPICISLSSDGSVSHEGYKLLRKEKKTRDESRLERMEPRRRKDVQLDRLSIGPVQAPKVWSIQLPGQISTLTLLMQKGNHSSQSLLSGYRTEPTFEFDCGIPIPGWQVDGTIMISTVVSCECRVGTGKFAMSAIGISGSNTKYLTCLGDACPESPEPGYDYTFQCLSSQSSLAQTTLIVSAGQDLKLDDVPLTKKRLKDLSDIRPDISLVAADVHTRDLLSLERLMESFTGDGNSAAPS